MKFDVLPIINETPNDAKYFRKMYEDSLTARLAHKQSKWVYLRTRLAEAQNWKCCFCGCYMHEVHGKRNSVTVEHVIPKSKGGTNEWENLAASCYACNNNRGTKDAEKFRPSPPAEKSNAVVRLEAKVRKYLKKAERFAEVGFNVNENIQSFDAWFSTLHLCAKGKEMFFAEYKAA
jgi:5-methylcytosine-specific restriction endonuclease McrA